MADKISETDFFAERHRLIYRSILDVWVSGEAIDRVTVANELRRKGDIERVGGLSYLVDLDTNMPRVANIDSYIRLVREKAALREGAQLAQTAMNRFLADDEPAERIVTSVQDAVSGLYLKLDNRQQKDFITPLAAIERYEGGINTFLDPSKRSMGVSTGFTKLDEMTGGMRGGDYIIIAARPGMGKTALALNIAWHVAYKLKLTVPIFSLEMSVESLVTRMACSVARVDSQRFRAGYLNDGDRIRLRNAIDSITSSPIYIDDSTGITMAGVSAKLRRLKAQNGGIGLVVIDYLQLMTDKGENRNQEVTHMSRAVKLLAKELACPFLVLSQLSRQTELRGKGSASRPQLSDLRESGSLEQDADVVAFIFRPEVYDRSREDLRGHAEIILAKQREGPTGIVNLTFLHSQTRFENRAEDLGEEPQ